MQQLIKAILDFIVALFSQKTETKVVRKEKVSQVKNIDLIKKHEGLRLKAYLPTPNDVWTIGYGHTRNVRPGQVISQSQAEDFLRQDLDWVESSLNKSVKVPLKQNQYDALASLVYNIGATNFQSSTLLRKLNTGDYKGASEQFLVWNKQKGRTLKGLVKRRQEEKDYFDA